MSVAIDPGAIALTRILCLLHSLLSALVRLATAALAAEYDATRFPPTYELRDATLIMFPRPLAIKCFPAAWEMKKSELRLMLTT